MRIKAISLGLLFASAAFCHDDVITLGDAAETAAGTRAGGFFSALMTSGNFMMMQVLFSTTFFDSPPPCH